MAMLFRNVRSSKRKIALQDLNSITRKQIEETMEKQVKQALIKSHEKIVADWEHKPKFQSRKYIRPDRIAENIFPTGPNAKIWRFVDEGTRPHVIKAKNVPRLIFKTGYVSKTLARPARTVSGGGKYTGPTVSAVAVNHPGNEAREFTKTIAEDIKPEFKRVIENAFRKAARQVKE